MRKQFMVLLAGLILVSACAPAAVTTPAPTSPPATSPPATSPPTSTPTELPTPEATDTPVPPTATEEPGPDGLTLLQERCAVCHTLGRVEAARKSLEGWQTTVERMVGHGAVLTAEEQQALVEYLAETYPE
jgi:cytochrome c5